MRRPLALLSLALLIAVPSFATTWHVPGDFQTIQAGLNAAVTGDTVLVAAGEYQESLFWPFRNGIVLIGAGMDRTTVVGGQVETVVYMVHASIDSTTVIRGLMFRDGGDAGMILDTASPIVDSCNVASTRGGPGIFCLGGSLAIIRNCRIADNAGSGVHCLSSSPSITGNSITGCTASYGGGVFCDNSSSPTITGNNITGNTAGFGGGVGSVYSSPVITGNTITQNIAPSFGGGIYCRESSLTLTGNTIAQNSATDGGGVYSESGFSMTVTENTITGNSAYRGGGVYCFYSPPTLTGNTITQNNASYGGGIGCNGSSPTLAGNAITGNYAEQGGGVYCNNYSAPTLTGNTITRNTASSDGGGVYCRESSPTLTGNTITQNTASSNGGGVHCGYSSSPIIAGNTITENIAGGRGDGIHTTEGSNPAVSACNLAWNGWAFHNSSAVVIPNIQGNWWGDSSGPWHSGLNPEGLGDSLSNYAWDFIPWLQIADTAAPPIPPHGLQAQRGTGAIDLTWLPVPIGDLAGYRVYFDTDEPGFPYADTVDVGNVTEYTLEGLEAGTTYYLAVTCYDIDGNESWYSREVAPTIVPDLVQEEGGMASGLRLEPSFPNPFQSQTTVTYVLSGPRWVRLTVHDLQGRRLATLAEGNETAGSHARVWRAEDVGGRPVASGVYFVRLESAEGVLTQKVVATR